MDQAPVPEIKRRERYSRKTRDMALAQMRFIGRGPGGPFEIAQLITPHCHPATPRRWAKERLDAYEGRTMIALMLQNTAAGRPVEEGVPFAEVPPVANRQNARPARMGQ